MFRVRSLFATVLTLLALTLLQACSDSPESAVPEKTAPDNTASAEEHAENAVTGEQEDDAIDPESLEPAGEVELKQYTVAYGGSGTLGGGTLTIDGKSYPFSIAGLGYGGIGASSVEATGVVYNLPSLEDFPGTYGNARLGMTAGDSGGGKLWLRKSDGVVIELESEMRGLALAGGVDGLVIQWDTDEDSTTDRVLDDTQEVVGDGVEAGADAVEKGIGKVKGWMKGGDD